MHDQCRLPVSSGPGCRQCASPALQLNGEDSVRREHDSIVLEGLPLRSLASSMFDESMQAAADHPGAGHVSQASRVEQYLAGFAAETALTRP
jgi:hypothetical protein